jgi:hypothetical protein
MECIILLGIFLRQLSQSQAYHHLRVYSYNHLKQLNSFLRSSEANITPPTSGNKSKATAKKFVLMDSIPEVTEESANNEKENRTSTQHMR